MYSDKVSKTIEYQDLESSTVKKLPIYDEHQKIKDLEQNITEVSKFVSSFMDTDKTKEEFEQIVGKENNPFEEETITYLMVQDYIQSIQNHMCLFSENLISEKTDPIKGFPYLTVFLSLLSMGLWLINFFHYEGFPYAFRCAKGFGLNLRIFSLIMFLSMCRTLIPISTTYEIHVISGYILMLATLGHTICHFIFTNGILPVNYVYISGIFLLVIYVIMIISSHYRKKGYDIFLNIHRLSYLILPLCILHVPNLWIWFFIVLFIYSLENTYNFIYKFSICSLENAKIIKENKVIYLPIPTKTRSISGSYYKICVPSISLEWHSFSVANSEFTDQLLFLIETRGDWTQKLYTKVLNESNSHVLILGPFLTTSTNIIKKTNKRKLCIATGLGIAPFLSVLDTSIDLVKINNDFRKNYMSLFDEKLEQKQSFTISNVIKTPNHDKTFSLKCIWVLREPIFSMLEHIKYIFSESINHEIDIYITTKEINNIKIKFHLLKFLNNCNRNIKIHIGRPNLKKIIEDEHPKSINFCGTPFLREEIKAICSCKDIDFDYEIFD